MGDVSLDRPIKAEPAAGGIGKVKIHGLFLFAAHPLFVCFLEETFCVFSTSCGHYGTVVYA